MQNPTFRINYQLDKMPRANHFKKNWNLQISKILDTSLNSLYGIENINNLIILIK